VSPLITSVATGVDSGAKAFERWATTSDGPTKFVAYATSALPKVIAFLQATGTAIGHIVVAAGPLGGVTLTALTAIVRIIGAIPVGVLQILVPLLIATGLAMKGLAVASAVSVGNDAIRRYLEASGNGRLVQSLKSFLADKTFESTDIMGENYTLGDLIAPIIKAFARRRDRAVRRTTTANRGRTAGPFRVDGHCR